MKKHLKSVVALTAICAVVALLLSFANTLTAPIIEKNQSAAANEALLVVMPEGKDFTSVDLSQYELPATVTEVFAESAGGYVVKLTTAGYSTGMVIMCGVDAAGKVTGATCLSSGETLGVEKTYGENTVGKTLEDIEGVDTVASATKTTAAYRNAVKDALNAAVILGGGTVDLRSEEEILADHLAAALPEAQGAFTEWFMVEELEGVSAVYLADNGSGAVFVKGEEFVVDPALAKVVAETKTQEIDLSKYELNTAIKKVEKTSGGNYVFEVEAYGFGINGDSYYNPSGEPILLKASLTAEGKIIACKTLSQKETDGFGSACADPEFYRQFNSRDESNYREIDAISGATITTNGYKTAIGKLFEAVKILKGAA